MAVGLIMSGLVLVAGCSDMKDQPHHEPLEKSTFFADGRSSRPLVEGSVARGHLRADDRIYRGLGSNGHFVQHVPIPVDRALLERGQQRYDIYCAPCHGRRGDGLGMIVRRGYKQPPSYHSERLRITQDGYIYNVISNGYGKMSSYAAQIKPTDRWAIVAYIRALQLSQFSELTSVDSEIQSQLRRGEVVDTRVHEDESQEGHHGTGH
jgi:cytochrome c553